MATDPNKTVFISYRRAVSRDRALLVFDYLRKRRYDVFIDIEKIDSGAFDKVILNQIGARTHFVLLLTNGSLERCQYEGDWLRREIEEALRLGRNIVPVVDEHFDFEREMAYLPDEWRKEFSKLNMLPWVHYYYKSVLKELRERFLNLPVFPVTITPVSEDEQHEVAERLAKITQALTPDAPAVDAVPEIAPVVDETPAHSPAVEQVEEPVTPVESVQQAPIEQAPRPVKRTKVPPKTTTPTAKPKVESPPPAKKPEIPPRKIITPYTTSLKIMPAPFAWINIPAGKVTLSHTGGYLKQATTFDVPAFQIAKYPVTNAQFDVFINHPDGYKDPQWWAFSDDAKQWRIEKTQPQDKHFSGDTHPRVNVCWYEAVAFCRWLSAITGEKVMLPTEQQWQRAAQGDDGREYPWKRRWSKEQWDATRCNNSVSDRSEGTTPVTQYEGKGDSPFGVVDMAGNVWEWCLTAYGTGSNTFGGTDVRVLRGGSWLNDFTNGFRAVFRNRNAPVSGNGSWGFRIVCSR